MKIAELKIKTKINKSKMKKRKLETPGLREEKHKMGNNFFCISHKIFITSFRYNGRQFEYILR